MGKNNIKRGLGRGLDSLIPKIEEKEEKNNENSSLTLEDILENKNEEESQNKEEKEKEKLESQDKDKKIEEELGEEIKEIEKEVNKDEENTKILTEELIKETNIEKSEEKDNAISEEVKENKIAANSEPKPIYPNNEVEIVENLEIEKEDSESKVNVATIEEIEVKKDLKASLNDYELDSIEEVKEIIEKNPRITLWSSKSSAVFRYLRKTRPEFSISKEASELVDKGVSEKYPEIWELFKDL